MSKKDSSCTWFLDEWFYQVVLILIGIVVLAVNLGYVSQIWLSYWPVLLIVTAVKEMMERK